MVLKKEVANSSNGSSSESGADSADLASYRQSLVRTLHSCSIRFTSVAPAVVPLVCFVAIILILTLIVEVLSYLSCWSFSRIVMKGRLRMFWCL